MTDHYPAAAYARTLSDRERASFITLPLLRLNPLRAIRSFESRRKTRG